MRVNACSVAFRHMQPTAPWLAAYVADHGFDGIEIWAPHAQRLASDWAALPWRPRVTMLSGYLPLGSGVDEDAIADLCTLAVRWKTQKLRLFAGDVGSDAPSDQRAAILDDLRCAVVMGADHGLQIAVEIHPLTLADSPAAALDVVRAVDHPALGLNYDVLHVWEAGADPVAALGPLLPHVLHYHLKSVTRRDRLGVFDSANVHDPKGSRDGMCGLFGGAPDYDAILAALPDGAETSLEWFGPSPASAMSADLRRIRNRRASRAA